MMRALFRLMLFFVVLCSPALGAELPSGQRVDRVEIPADAPHARGFVPTRSLGPIARPKEVERRYQKATGLFQAGRIAGLALAQLTMMALFSARSRLAPEQMLPGVIAMSLAGVLGHVGVWRSAKLAGRINPVPLRVAYGAMSALFGVAGALLVIPLMVTSAVDKTTVAFGIGAAFSASFVFAELQQKASQTHRNGVAVKVVANGVVGVFQ